MDAYFSTALQNETYYSSLCRNTRAALSLEMHRVCILPGLDVGQRHKKRMARCETRVDVMSTLSGGPRCSLNSTTVVATALTPAMASPEGVTEQRWTGTGMATAKSSKCFWPLSTKEAMSPLPASLYRVGLVVVGLGLFGLYLVLAWVTENFAGLAGQDCGTTESKSTQPKSTTTGPTIYFSTS